MVTMLGVDPHKATHTATAVDANGKALGEMTVKARSSGHAELIGWARQSFPGERRWAVEDERNMAGLLIRDLLAAGERVIPVPAHLAAEKRRTRRRGKSDGIDALMVARTALRESLSEIVLDESSRELKLLSDHRQALVNERTRAANRLRDLLHQLDPDYAASFPAGGLSRYWSLADIIDRFAADDSVAASIVLDLAHACHANLTKVKELDKKIKARVQASAKPLLDLPGCAQTTAAIIVGEVANVHRFRSDAALATYAGTAPLDASSGKQDHHRLNRGGNRRLNYAIHIIALTQLRIHAPARLYYQQKINQGSTPKVAIRALKRMLTRKIHNILEGCTDKPHSTGSPDQTG
jgi:transposase